MTASLSEGWLLLSDLALLVWSQNSTEAAHRLHSHGLPTGGDRMLICIPQPSIA